MADDIGKKVERFGQNIWAKTQDAFGVVSKNSEIAAKSRELRTVYAEIGRRYCEQHAQDGDEAFPELCANALRLASEIAELEAEVLAKRGYRKCPSCGESVDTEAAFCPSCGAAQPKQEPEEETDDERRCSACQSEHAEDDRFCPNCGAKLP